MPEALIQEEKKGLFDGFSWGQLFATVLAAVAVSVIAGALSVWVTQARTSDRIEAIGSKQTETDNRIETYRERRDQEIKDIRDHTITRGEFDTYKEMLKEVRDDVRALLMQHSSHAEK